jgi:hypothetical protein
MSAARKKEADVASEVVEAAGAVTVLGPLEKIRAGLAALAQEAMTFDVTTTAGDKAARQFRQRCVGVRSSVDEAYETVNRPMLETQRQARALRDEIKAAVLKLEDPVDAAIRAQEEAKQAERARKEQAERERIAGHQGAIEEIRMAVHAAAGRPSAEIAALVRQVQAVNPAEGFEEFRPLAERARTETLIRLADLLAAAQAQEAEAARLAEERAQLERQRVEQEAAAKAERERLEAERAALERERAVARVEQEQREAAARAEAQREAEASAAEQRRLDAEAAEARRAADAKAAAERAEADRQARLAREAEDRRIAAERAELKLQQDEAARVERERRAAEEAEVARQRAAQAEADDRLRAAAGVMLAALERVQACDAFVFMDPETRTTVDQAVTQATGRALPEGDVATAELFGVPA